MERIKSFEMTKDEMASGETTPAEVVYQTLGPTVITLDCDKGYVVQPKSVPAPPNASPLTFKLTVAKVDPQAKDPCTVVAILGQSTRYDNVVVK